MSTRSNLGRVSVAAVLVLALLPASALCEPVSMHSEREEESASQARAPLTAAEIVLMDARLETLPQPFAANAGESRATAGTAAGANLLGRNFALGRSGSDGLLVLDHDAGAGAASFRDALRALVNAQPLDPGTRRRPARNRAGGGPGASELDLAPELREWIQGAVHEVVDTMLRPEVNPRGRVSFSVLGHGEFNIDVSADRGQVALSAGEDVLLTTQRIPPPTASNFDHPLADPRDVPPPGQAPNTSGNPMRAMLEDLADAAAHPIAYIVYALLLAYALLWSVLSRTRTRKKGRTRRKMRLAHAYAASGAHALKRARRKIRVRVRVRRRR